MLQLLKMDRQPRAYASNDDDESSYSSNINTGSLVALPQLQPRSIKASMPRATRTHRTATATVARADESSTKSYKPRARLVVYCVCVYLVYHTV